MRPSQLINPPTTQQIGLELFMQLEQPNDCPFLPETSVILLAYERARSSSWRGKSLRFIVQSAVNSVDHLDQQSGTLLRYSKDRRPDLAKELESVGYHFD